MGSIYAGWHFAWSLQQKQIQLANGIYDEVALGPHTVPYITTYILASHMLRVKYCTCVLAGWMTVIKVAAVLLSQEQGYIKHHYRL